MKLMPLIYGIWDVHIRDWVREMPSKVDDGGFAILAFASPDMAMRRAAKHFGFRIYSEAKRAGYCIVLPLVDGRKDKSEE